MRNVHCNPIFSFVGATGGNRVERGPDREGSVGATGRAAFRGATLDLLAEDFIASSRRPAGIRMSDSILKSSVGNTISKCRILSRDP